jgi:hypothetical protein
MSMGEKTPRRSGLRGADVAVGNLVSQYQAQKDKEEGKTGRGQPGNSGEAGKDSAGRYKISADVKPGRREEIETMATALGMSKSDIVDAALANMWTLFEEGKINLDLYKVYVPNEKQPGKGGIKLNLPRLFKFVS